MSEESARISVKVKPRASRDAIEGWREGTLVVRLTSPPVEGAANASLIKLLSRAARVPKGQIRIVTGEKGRSKILQFEGVNETDLKERLK